MSKTWLMVAFVVVSMALLMILRDRLPSPVGEVGFALVEGLDSSFDWLRGVFNLRV